MLTFRAPSGNTIPAVTAEQMREVDRVAVQETGPDLLQMMENAGRNLAALTIRTLGQDWRNAKVLILAGSGGNGGGGICAGRHLANRGVHVALWLATPEKKNTVVAHQHRIFTAAGGRDIGAAALPNDSFDIILDALIGYGLQSAPHGSLAEVIGWANQSATPILSLDVPSGVDATTGACPGAFLQPDITMTLALPKTGLLMERSGDVYLADIGIPAQTFHTVGIDYRTPFADSFLIPIKAVEEGTH